MIMFKVNTRFSFNLFILSIYIIQRLYFRTDLFEFNANQTCIIELYMNVCYIMNIIIIS